MCRVVGIVGVLKVCTKTDMDKTDLYGVPPALYDMTAAAYDKI
jgi:hypothetical protein